MERLRDAARAQRAEVEVGEDDDGDGAAPAEDDAMKYPGVKIARPAVGEVGFCMTDFM